MSMTWKITNQIQLFSLHFLIMLMSCVPMNSKVIISIAKGIRRYQRKRRKEREREEKRETKQQTKETTTTEYTPRPNNTVTQAEQQQQQQRSRKRTDDAETREQTQGLHRPRNRERWIRPMRPNTSMTPGGAGGRLSERPHHRGRERTYPNHHKRARPTAGRHREREQKEEKQGTK